MTEAFRALEAALGHVFTDKALLLAALTHSSHANEQGGTSVHYERLEFLGDAVLELTVSEELFLRFPESPEGVLTLMRSRLVSEPTLAEAAKAVSLDAFVRLGRGEESQGGRQRAALLSDVFEAVTGAVFLDGGYGAAKAVVARVFAGRWPVEPAAPKVKDYKSRLQEYTQKRHKTRPVYTLAGSAGPEHEKLFEVRLALPSGEVVTATDKSVKKAEQRAAKAALERLAKDGEP